LIGRRIFFGARLSFTAIASARLTAQCCHYERHGPAKQFRCLARAGGDRWQMNAQPLDALSLLDESRVAA
jgi:hypothetical protein